MGGNKVYRGIYFGDREWREETRFTWFPADLFESRLWQSQDPGPNSPSFKLIRKISERVNAPPPSAIVPSVAAVYVADQYIGGSSKPSSTQVIVKIHMRIPYVEVREGNTYVSTNDLLSQPLPIPDEIPDVPMQFHPGEVDCLRHLTDHKCPYTPSLITSFEIRKDNPWIKDGLMGFIVMEKLSAVTMDDIWVYEPDSEDQRQKHLRMQEAFKIALLTVHNLGIMMGDPSARNLMWDEKAGKCYLIDFEDAWLRPNVTHFDTWEEFEQGCKAPYYTFASWNILMKDQSLERWKVNYPRAAELAGY